jgi:hypothetical protein
MEKTLEEHGWTLKDLEAAMLEPWSPLKDNNNKSINHENMTDKENVDKNLVSLSNHMNKISLNAKVTDSKEHFISNISEILNQPLINGWSLFDHQ